MCEAVEKFREALELRIQNRSTYTYYYYTYTDLHTAHYTSHSRYSYSTLFQ